MTEFTIHTAANAPEAARAPLATLEQTIGFIPNLAATIAGSPTALAGFVGMQSALRGSRLTRVEREVVGVTVSHANACPYFDRGAHAFAAHAGADAATVAALRAAAPLADLRLEALRAFTLAVLDARGHADADLLLAAGYEPEHVLEALAQIAYTTFANLVANVADTPVDAGVHASAGAGRRRSSPRGLNTETTVAATSIVTFAPTAAARPQADPSPSSRASMPGPTSSAPQTITATLSPSLIAVQR